MSYLTVTFRELLEAHLLDVHLPNILIGIGDSVEVPMVTVLGRRIGKTQPQTARFVSLSAISRTLVDIPCGIIVEYVGVRTVMLFCLLLNALAAFIGLTIDDSASLATYCALSGISLGGFFLARHIFVAGISSKKYRGMLMSILSGLLRWAHVIGPSLSGLIATRTGDVRIAFVIPIASALGAFLCLALSAMPMCQRKCAESCTESRPSSLLPTPSQTDEDEFAMDGAEAGSGGHPRIMGDEASVVRVSGAGASSSGSPYGQHPYAPPLLSQAAVSALPSRPPITVGEGSVVSSVHPSMAAGEEHYFKMSALWYTLLDYKSIIWRLGLYIIFFTAIRANRKILLSFAAMRENMSDAEVNYLLSVSFMCDAVLFPLGGVIMDVLGRQFAMVPVVIGLSSVFVVLPFCNTRATLYAAAAGFGVADALGCGVTMTLTADRAPKQFGAPFFGIMRTIQDLGHVLGSMGIASLLERLGFQWSCWTLSIIGVCTALWGVFGVPRDEKPLETPRLERSVHRHQARRYSAVGQSDAAFSENPVSQPLLRSSHGGGGGAGAQYGAVH